MHEASMAAGGTASFCEGPAPRRSAAARLVASVLVDASDSNPVVFAGAASFLGLVALTASALPALRASRLDPAVSPMKR